MQGSEDGAGIFLRLEAGIGAELIGGIPQALFQRGGGVVFFGRGQSMGSGVFLVSGVAKPYREKPGGGFVRSNMPLSQESIAAILKS